MTEYRIPDHLAAELIDLVEAADVNAAERTAADYAGNNQRVNELDEREDDIFAGIADTARSIATHLRTQH